MAAHFWNDQAPQRLIWTCLALGAAGAAAMAASPRWRQGAAEAARAGAGMLLAGGAYFLFVGAQEHVAGNLFHIRYLYPAMPFAELALVAPALVPLARALDARAFRAACAVGAACVLAGSAFTFGAPAPGSIRADLEKVSPLTAEVIALRCTHVAGYYWTTWPAVVMANAELYRRGERRQVYGIAHRASVTLDQATAMRPEDVRICAGVGDPQAVGWLRTYRFPDLVVLERGEKVAVLGIRRAPP
jgi:hypothetical protein